MVQLSEASLARLFLEHEALFSTLLSRVLIYFSWLELVKRQISIRPIGVLILSRRLPMSVVASKLHLAAVQVSSFLLNNLR
jgi:hypothetical protein